MLSGLSLINFKGFESLEEFSAKPITILAGSNSSGKSSIIQSLMLVKQSLGYNNSTQSILLNGKYVSLGTYENIVYDHNTKNEISLEASFILRQNEIKRFGGRRSATSAFQIANLFCGSEINNDTLTVKISLSFKELRRVISDEIVTFINVTKFEFSIESRDVSNDSFLSQIEFTQTNSSNPDRYEVKWNNVRNRISHSRSYSGSEVLELTFNNLIPNLSISSTNNTKRKDAIRSLPFVFNAMGDMINFIFSQISYIGPLREKPSRRYIYENEINDVGTKGENAAYLYANSYNLSVRDHYFLDQTENSFVKIDQIKLRDAVKKWMEIMGVNAFSTRKRDDIIYLEMQSRSKTEVSIADVGFGVSQVFPIILEGLKMDVGDTLILEQPEIHLHPKLQMQVADYAVSLALSGKSVIIETHSDHLINRLVRRIIESDESINDLIGICFISEKDGAMLVEPIEIDENRGIVNWPTGFFDQYANESELIIKASMNKRKKRKDREANERTNN